MDIEKISKSVRFYVYLVLTSQVQARSSIAGDSAPAVDAQQVCKSTFKALINEAYTVSTDIRKYQEVLEIALSEIDFSMDTGIYMLQSDLNLNIGEKKGYSNKTLVSNTGMEIGSNREINKDHKKLTPPEPAKAKGVAHDAPEMTKRSNKPVKNCLATHHDNSRIYSKEHSGKN